MDDRFMTELREEPTPAFSGALRARLRRAAPVPRHKLAWRPAVAAVAAVAVVAGLFAFPSVRASAQAVLDLFRVRNFAPVSFDPTRFDKLRGTARDNPTEMFGKAEVLQDPGQPVVVPNTAAASARAGIDVREVRDLSGGMRLDSIWVAGAGVARFTASVPRLQDALQTLGINDVTVPANLDGKAVTVHKPPIVVQRYKNDRRRAVLLQARSPEVELPAGVDLSELAEIGMRILGLDRHEAHQLARSVDWHSTLLVPVPQNASSFRRVEVHGQPGLMVTMREGATKERRGRDGTMVLWSEGDRVYALNGDLDQTDMLAMAESVR